MKDEVRELLRELVDELESCVCSVWGELDVTDELVATHKKAKDFLAGRPARIITFPDRGALVAARQAVEAALNGKRFTGEWLGSHFLASKDQQRLLRALAAFEEAEK